MSTEIREILTNKEVLAVHKDPLAKMAVRIDVGGGVDAGHYQCNSAFSVYGRQLVDGSSAVLVLNRGDSAGTTTVHMEDVGDSMHLEYAVRDLWGRKDLPAAAGKMAVEVPGRGVRLFRMSPTLPPACPPDFDAHASGYWHNTDPCPNNVWSNCTADSANGTVVLCAAKCRKTDGCVAFEMPTSGTPACYMFLGELSPPFVPYAQALTCQRKTGSL
jgi:hypothetical protein